MIGHADRDKGFADRTEAALGHPWPPRHSRILRISDGAAGRGWPVCGFTLIELLVVMAVIALLLTLAAPRYLGSVDKSKEVVLKENLMLMRDSIDKYYGDQGRYPDAIEDLVTKKYLRRIPPDPITESATTWVVVPPEDPQKGAVYDVRSGATEPARDGTAYGDW